MKKLLAIVLAACLALTLVACGGAPSNARLPLAAPVAARRLRFPAMPM